MIENDNMVFKKAGDSSRRAHRYFLLPNISTASLPNDGTSMEGALAYDKDQSKLVVYNGNAWETVQSAQ